MTPDLFDGCAPPQAGRSCGVQSRRAALVMAKGNLGGYTHEAFQRNVEFAMEASDHFQG